MWTNRYLEKKAAPPEKVQQMDRMRCTSIQTA
jgi:hypothetical protein